ncbi:S8 family serine peptidase [Natronosporangium hydrolyticum]|uniref:S8 family serine peptidase n=1 Tax=Natronosporangium hydrolyticum TaxID=2811111 RepID=A0A895Y9S5_9ACTN|nr:S8 family serine peptidase [Natronosporangium hydrolyticum]QSB13012.1 S8 family serine peptidase [Natronosporangium hydrolyticum]
MILTGPGAAHAEPALGGDQGQAPPPAEKIQPELERSFDTDGVSDFWIRFADQADLSEAQQIDDWAARGEAVADALRDTAAVSQPGVRRVLDESGLEYRSFWATNAIYVHDGSPALAERFAERTEVAGLYAPVEYEAVQPELGTDAGAAPAVEWGVTNINADQAWDEFNTRGEGIVVANIDTGVQYDHPALVDKYRGNLGDGTFDHNYNWFDSDGHCADGPCDRRDHGTHVMGTMVGSTDEHRFGIAPGATWITTNGCCPNDATLIASGEWLLEPTDLNGENPDAGMRPHLINNSWGTTNPTTEDPFMEDVIEAWDASGILSIFSNGNHGVRGCESSGAPGSRSLTYSVGAYDVNDRIADGSSRGPGQDGTVKPNISAPGVGIFSSVPEDDYDTIGGTSMAAPHVSGAVALLWSAAPALVGDTATTRALLDQTAVDTEDLQCGGTPERNNVYGEGRLDALALLRSAPVGLAGTLTGTVTDAETGDPVAGAVVATDSEPVRETVTDPDGGYMLRLSEGDYTITTTHFGHLDGTADVTIAANETTTADFSLTTAPLVAVSGLVRDGSDQGWPLYAQVSVAGRDELTTYSDPFTGRYRLQVPADASYTLEVTPEYAGYETLERTVEVGSGNQTVDLSPRVEVCASAPGYQFSADVGVLGDYEIVDHLQRRGIGGQQVDWDDDMSAFDVIVLNRASHPTEEMFLDFLAETDAAGTGVVFLDTWDGRTGGNGIRLLHMYLDNPSEHGAPLFYDIDYTGYQVVQEHPLLDGFELGQELFHNTTEYTKYTGYFQNYGGEGRMVIANAINSDTGITGGGIGVQERDQNRHVLLSMHGTSFGNTPDLWHSDSVQVFENALDWSSRGDFNCGPVDGGLVAGLVTDENTGDGVVNASVHNSADPQQGTRSVHTAGDPALIDGFYALFVSPPGGQEVTAHAPAYAERTHEVEVDSGWVVRQDLALPAGELLVEPAEVSAEVPLGGSGNAGFTVTNTGGAPVELEFRQRTGGSEILRADGSTVPSSEILAEAGAPTQHIPTYRSTAELAGIAPDAVLGGAGPASTQAAPAAGPWLDLPSTPRNMMDNAAVTVAGQVYTFGGYAGLTTGGALDDVYRYDPVAQEWEQLGDMPAPRHSAAEGVIDGMVYLAGGWGSDGAEIVATLRYDPASDEWSTVAPSPVAFANGGSAVLDDELYVVGGCTTDSCAPYTDEVQRYSPNTDTWETLASYPMAIAYPSCGAIEGLLYCAGGTADPEPTTAAYVYDPWQDEWSPVAELPVDLWGSAYHTADGQLLVSGGASDGRITNEGFAYDPATDSWSRLPNANQAIFRAGSACGLYRVGGSPSGMNPSSQVELLPGFDQCDSDTEAEWLSVEPGTATVAPGETLEVTLGLTAGMPQPGFYHATVLLAQDSPYRMEPVSVTMAVTPPDTWGKLTGTVTARSCAGDEAPLASATVHLSTWVSEVTRYTDADGGYAYWLDHRHSPLDVIVAKDGYQPQFRQTEVAAGEVTVEDWTLSQVCHTMGPRFE